MRSGDSSQQLKVLSHGSAIPTVRRGGSLCSAGSETVGLGSLSHSALSLSGPSVVFAHRAERGLGECENRSRRSVSHTPRFRDGRSSWLADLDRWGRCVNVSRRGGLSFPAGAVLAVFKLACPPGSVSRTRGWRKTQRRDLTPFRDSTVRLGDHRGRGRPPHREPSSACRRDLSRASLWGCASTLGETRLAADAGLRGGETRHALPANIGRRWPTGMPRGRTTQRHSALHRTQPAPSNPNTSPLPCHRRSPALMSRATRAPPCPVQLSGEPDGTCGSRPARERESTPQGAL